MHLLWLAQLTMGMKRRGRNRREFDGNVVAESLD
jgi:hypothetical protein